MIVSAPSGISAQEEAPAQQEAPAAAPLLPIPLTDVPAQAAADTALIEEAELRQPLAPAFDAAEAEIAGRERSIAERLISLRIALAAASSRDAISELEQEWLEQDRLLEGRERQLREQAGVLERDLMLVSARSEVWQLTVDEARAASAPDELIDLAETSLANLRQAAASLQGLYDKALGLQGRVGRSRARVREALARISAEEAQLLMDLNRRDRPPLWSEANAEASIGELFGRAGRELSGWWSVVSMVLRNEPDRVALQGIILVVVALLVRRSRKAARAWTAAEPNVALGMSVFEKPLALAALIALSLTPWIYVSTPPAIGDLVALLLVAPVVRLVSPLLDKPVRPALYMLAALYVIYRLQDLIEGAPVVARLIFILEMIMAIAIAIWSLRSSALYGESQAR